MYLRRRAALFVCVLVMVVDYAIAVFGRAPNLATHLAVPLSLTATAIVGFTLGMWPGIAAAAAFGFCGAFLPDSSFGTSLVVLEIVLGGLVGVARDLTRSARTAEARFEREAARHRALAEHATDLVTVFAPDGNATYASESHATILGRTPGQMLGLGYYDAYGPSGVNLLGEALRDGGPGDVRLLELVVRHADGSARTIEGTLYNAVREPAVGGWIFNARDVSEVKNAEHRLIAAARFDELTALPNRAYLARRIDDALAIGNDACSAVLFVDLDRFKDVNDVLGHPAGDALLRQVAARLLACVRDGDLVGRIGGDEFVVMLARTRDAAETADVAQRIRQAVGAPYAIAGRELFVGASVGIANAAADRDATALLRQADVAMHAAKRRGDGVATFSTLQDERATRRLTMSTALHHAIERDELVLHFQPQIDVRTGALRAAEALVRWEHPDRGLLYPEYFLPLAQETGEMDRLTDWILRAAIVRARRWTRAGHGIRVAVNLSAYDLRDERLAEVVPRLLAQQNVDPHSLCLELSETTVMTEAESAAACLRGLAERGVRISIDDFGTGRSAITHLKAFPVDEIKIDKQFVINMEHDAEDAAIVAASIEIAHRLNVDVVVEGVERTSTLDAVRRLGARYAQGYAIGRPLSVAAFDRWIDERRGVRAIATG